MANQRTGDGDASRPDDIAIVGMDCIFPGAPNLQAFWDNIVNKKDAISDPPPEWDADLYYDPNSTDNDRLYTKKGGFLADLCAFDPLKHGVVPSTVDGGEPDQFLALEVASRALADADFAKRPVPGDRVEIVLGRGTSINRGISTLMHHGMFVDRLLTVLRTLHPEHTEDELSRIKEELKASLPPFNGEMAAALIPTLASGRIANRLGFQGANYLIDAACASSHIATQKGVEDLRAGRCDVAVVGGCQASTSAPNFMVFTQLSALSRRGEIRPFDKDADGTLMGEGIGILVLKRLADAETAGDRIYAVIKAIGVASDGRGAGILAPRVEGEVLALKRAYDESGVPPDTIELVEAHGTGTPLGDATEIASLKAMFGGRDPALPPIAVGAVKSMIGHCLPAAGSAGLIKTALALYTKVLPPTLHCENPNPAFELDASPLYINGETRPWIHGAPWPRRAGVNAFGFGGINAHAILEEYRGATAGDGAFPLRRPSEVLIVEAESREALVTRAQEASAAILTGTDRPLAEHARTLNTGLRQMPLRVAVVAASHEDAATKFADAAGRLGEANRNRIRDRRGLYFAAEPMGPKTQLGFMFPGEGSQYPNMLRDLCLHFPEVRAWFDRIDRAFIGHARGLLPSQVIFPPPKAGGSADKADMATLWRMDVGPEAIFAASQAVLALMRRIGLEPDAVVGHSTGEYSALIASGAYQFDDDKLVEDMRVLNQHFQRVSDAGLIARGNLIAVAGASGAALEALLAQRDDLYIAMDNCPQQQVVCALSEASAAWLEGQITAMSALSARLPFDRAYHTPAFQPFCDGLDAFFDRLQIRRPQTRLYSCVTAAPMPDDTAELQKLAIVQWASRVRFRETIERMYADGVSIFVECAPRNNLCAFVDDILRNRSHLALPVDTEHRDGITQLNHLIAQLAAEGVPLDLTGLYPPAETDGDRAPARPLMKLQAGLQPFKLAPRPDTPAERLPLPLKTAPPPQQARPAIASSPTNGASPPPLPPREPAAPAPPLWADETRVAATGEMFDEAPGETDTVLAAYLGTMDAFLRQQQQVMEAYLGGGEAEAAPEPPGASSPQIAALARAPQNGAAGFVAEAATVATPAPVVAASLPQAVERLATSPARFPLLYGGRLSDEDGQVVIRVGWDVGAHRYLLDHTMGRAVTARDPALTALPVVPFTFSMEALAEAAALATGKTVIGMHEVRAHRWIALDDGTIDLEIALPAVAGWGGDALRVVLRKARGPGDDPARPHPAFVEGTVLLGEFPRERPLAEPWQYRRARPSRWRPEDLYTEVMFHGPTLQAIASMERWGEDGSECTLVGMPREPLFGFTDAPEFSADPITTDAMGQLIGMWVSDEHEDGMHDFPFRLEQLDVYGPSLAPGERTLCRAHSAVVGAEDVSNGFHRSDIEVVGGDGRLRFRMTGWWDMRFSMPERFHAARCHTDRTPLSRAAPEWLPDGAADIACTVIDDVPLDFLEPSGEFWLRALSQMMLNRAEREVFRGMGGAKVERRAEWLLGRIAAKDAVRELLRRAGIPAVYPADIEIAAENGERPFVSAPWLTGAVPHVSIAHKAGRAVALAAARERYAGVGIDIESIEARSDGFVESAYSPAERELFAACRDDERALAMTRVWCAKEAVGKAFGWNLSEILARLEARGCGEVVPVATIGDPQPQDGNVAGPGPFAVKTVHDGSFVVALVAIPLKN